MTNEQKKSRLAHVPSIMAGAAALVAAVSTLYVNLRDPDPMRETRPSAVTAVVEAPGQSPTQAGPLPIILRLERVQVDNDGSAGSTDWSFEVSADGDPLFLVPMPDLSDEPGENLARPAEPELASAEIILPAARSVALGVIARKKGWRAGTRAELTASAWMASGFNKVSITLKSDKPDGPRFVLYFSATPVP